jgi:pimeloyl-ACP methyl ester carboxylesterase
MAELARRGYLAISLDLRGHGESDWSPEGDYSLGAFVADLQSVCSQLATPPVLVGASLGGLTSLLFAGEHPPEATRALILVDVAPQIETAGAERIGAFMRARPDGFASVDEAADAVAAYLPHRPRPKDTSGLRRNLRLGADGRYRWHWDPKFTGGDKHVDPASYRERLEAAARNLRVPTLLVRGGISDVVSLEGARQFLSLAPQAEFIDVAGADHMVAGDRNDAFNESIIAFLDRNRIK